MEDSRKQFGSSLKFFRKEAGLTQDELAQIVGVHQTAIAQFEKGKTLPTAENFKKIKDTLLEKAKFHAEEYGFFDDVGKLPMLAELLEQDYHLARDQFRQMQVINVTPNIAESTEREERISNESQRYLIDIYNQLDLSEQLKLLSFALDLLKSKGQSIECEESNHNKETEREG